MLLVAIGALTPTDAHAKHCGTACSAEIASCQVTCTLGGRWARRRCRGACKRSIIASCRAYDGPECVDPATSSTVPDTTTTTTTTAPLASTSTTSELGILTTTSTTLPGAPVPTGFFPTMHVTSSQVDRTYSLFVPPSYDPNRAYPIVFAFHGDGGTGADVRDALALEAQASGAAIFVYPDATEESGRHWTLDASLNSNPDMLFFLDIITQLSAVYRLDETQRFATGLSSGAYFVNFLNCTLGTTYLRAIAPHSGSGPYGPPGSYDQDGHFECAAQAAAAMLIHGTIDDVVPLSDAEYSHQQWVWGNHCADTSSNGPGPAPCVEHDACDPGRPVDWCAVPGLGHEVWGLAPQAIWGFFARFLDRPPPPPGGATMKVMGRDLYDADGEKVVLRGVNKMNVFDPNDHDGSVSFPDIHATGANTVRIVWMTRTAFFVPTAQDLDTVIGNAIAHHLVPMIELHDATGNLALVSSLVDYWTRPDIAAVLRKYQRFLLVNIANEAGAWDTTADEFTATYQDAVTRMRAVGIHAPLVIDAPDSGKNIDVLLATAAQLENADPDRNLLFSVHIYWAMHGGRDAGYIWSKLGAAVAAGMPLVVGEFSRYGAWTAPDVSLCAPAGEVDYQAVLQAAGAYGIGWYSWEWGPGNGYTDPACAVMDMTSDDHLATLQPGWATDVVAGPYGIAATSVIPGSLKGL